MEILLLGTGSADGWPNPFCACTSCGWARSAGVVRTPTAALIDGHLLLDCGPSVGAVASRAGADFTGLDAVLVTHVHNDHFEPSNLLYRTWVTERPLRVVGPPPVISAAAPWLAPGEPSIVLTPVLPGDGLEIAGYTVRVLAADHDAFGVCVLYDVLGPIDAGGTAGTDRARVLYATDTGPLPDETLSHIAGTRYDLVLLEETFGDRPLERGHLDLPSFGEQVRRLRSAGCIDDRTDVIAIHLSHHNPPGPELEARLAAYGARAVPDGTLVRVDSGGPRKRG